MALAAATHLSLEMKASVALQELIVARQHGDPLTIQLAEAALNDVLDKLSAETKSTETTEKKKGWRK